LPVLAVFIFFFGLLPITQYQVNTAFEHQPRRPKEQRQHPSRICTSDSVPVSNLANMFSILTYDYRVVSSEISGGEFP